ncbi:hypothetical protein H1R20_g8188, partial [Candolleomyces eurysporus]
MSDEEYDNIPDAFADVEGVDWAAILAGPTAGPSGHASPLTAVPHDNNVQVPPQNTVGSPVSSYFDDDYLDSGTLAEIDEIERQATQAAGSSGSFRKRIGFSSRVESM